MIFEKFVANCESTPENYYAESIKEISDTDCSYSTISHLTVFTFSKRFSFSDHMLPYCCRPALSLHFSLHLDVD